MSNTVLKVIFNQPAFSMSAQDRKKFYQKLVSILFTAEPTILEREYDEIQFINPGEKLTQIGCPHCQKDISFSWWQEQMAAAGKAGYRDLSVSTPCCGRPSSLNDLSYNGQAGFSKHVIEISDSDRLLDPLEIQSKLDNVLSVGVRVISARA